MSATEKSLLDRWRLILVLLWLAACVWLLWQRWGAIHTRTVISFQCRARTFPARSSNVCSLRASIFRALAAEP